jgi:hypothetical protein
VKVVGWVSAFCVTQPTTSPKFQTSDMIGPVMKEHHMRTREDNYRIARASLNNVLTRIRYTPAKNELYLTGKKIHYLLNSYHPATMSDHDLRNMTNWINGITAVIDNPLNNDALANHINNTELAKCGFWLGRLLTGCDRVDSDWCAAINRGDCCSGGSHWSSGDVSGHVWPAH